MIEIFLLEKKCEIVEHLALRQGFFFSPLLIRGRFEFVNFYGGNW